MSNQKNKKFSNKKVSESPKKNGTYYSSESLDISNKPSLINSSINIQNKSPTIIEPKQPISENIINPQCKTEIFLRPILISFIFINSKYSPQEDSISSSLQQENYLKFLIQKKFNKNLDNLKKLAILDDKMFDKIKKDIYKEIQRRTIEDIQKNRKKNNSKEDNNYDKAFAFHLSNLKINSDDKKILVPHSDSKLSKLDLKPFKSFCINVLIIMELKSKGYCLDDFYKNSINDTKNNNLNESSVITETDQKKNINIEMLNRISNVNVHNKELKEMEKQLKELKKINNIKDIEDNNLISYDKTENFKEISDIFFENMAKTLSEHGVSTKNLTEFKAILNSDEIIDSYFISTLKSDIPNKKFEINDLKNYSGVINQVKSLKKFENLKIIEAFIVSISEILFTEDLTLKNSAENHSQFKKFKKNYEIFNKLDIVDVKLEIDEDISCERIYDYGYKLRKELSEKLHL